MLFPTGYIDRRKYVNHEQIELCRISIVQIRGKTFLSHLLVKSKNTIYTNFCQ